MSLDLPHTKDLATNSKLPGYIAANNLAAEEEDKKDDKALEQEVQDRKDADKREAIDRQGQINALRTRLSTAEGNITDLQKRTASLEEQVKKINGILFGVEYITDTNVNTGHTIDVPASIMVNDEGNGDELSGLTIEEQKGEN